MVRLLLLVSLFCVSSAPVRAQLQLPVRLSEIANLTYQLDCISKVVQACRSDVFEPLWADRFLTTPEDSVQLQTWRHLRERYSGRVHLDEGETVRMSEKVRIAGFQAESVEDYARNLDLLMTPGDQIRAVAALQHFYPAFQAWWRDEASGVALAYADAMVDAIRDKEISRWMTRFASFYESDLPDGYAVPVHLIYRPESEVRYTSAQMVGNHAVVEFLPGETPEARLDVVTHEAAHFLYRSAPDERHASTEQWFTAQEAVRPGAIPAYRLLNEAVATALGNGRVGETVFRAPDRWEEFLAIPQSLYAQPEIDQAAKAILPSIGDWMDQGGTLHDPAFLTSYLAQVHDAIGEPLARPERYLNEMTLFVDDGFGGEVRRMVLQTLRPASLSAYQSPCCDAEWVEELEAAPAQSAVVIIPPEALEALQTLGLLEAENVREIEQAMTEGHPVLYSVSRTPQARLYVIATETASAAATAVQALASAPALFDGVYVASGG